MNLFEIEKNVYSNSQGWEKPVPDLKKKKPTYLFSYFLKTRFFFFYFKETKFCS